MAIMINPYFDDVFAKKVFVSFNDQICTIEFGDAIPKPTNIKGSWADAELMNREAGITNAEVYAFIKSLPNQWHLYDEFYASWSDHIKDSSARRINT